MSQQFKEEQLSAFAQVAECGSFTLAARKLGCSQAAVSQSVKGLEQQLGYTVLDRQSGRVVLSGRGSDLYALYQQRRQALSKLTQLAEHARLDVESNIHLHLSGLLDQRALVPCLQKFHQQFPFTRLHITGNWTTADLVVIGGEAALLLDAKRNASSPQAAKDAFSWQVFVDIQMIPVCGALASQPRYIAVPWGPSRSEQSYLSTSKPAFAWQMVRDNMGWTWLPEHMLASAHEGTAFRRFTKADPFPLRCQLGLRRQPSERASRPALSALSELLRTWAQQHNPTLKQTRKSAQKQDAHDAA